MAAAGRRDGDDASARALVESAVWWEPGTRLIRVDGSDAFDYLQRMISADLRRLRSDQGLLATILTGKGKLVAPFEAIAVGPTDGGSRSRTNSFLLLADELAAGPLEERLRGTIILEDVEIESWSGVYSLVTVQGPGAAGVLATLLGANDLSLVERSCRAVDRGWVIRRRRSAASGWDCVLPQSEAAEFVRSVSTQLGHPRATPFVVECARIEAGEPKFGTDATDANLPPECGYEPALSYDKGCYAGQEVVARIRTYGHVNKVLRRVRFEPGPSPVAGAEILVAGQAVGRLTSVGSALRSGVPLALGFVKFALAERGGSVEVVTADGSTIRGVLEELADSGV